jgi:hypothetical protein
LILFIKFVIQWKRPTEIISLSSRLWVTVGDRCTGKPFCQHCNIFFPHINTKPQYLQRLWNWECMRIEKDVWRNGQMS